MKRRRMSSSRARPTRIISGVVVRRGPDDRRADHEQGGYLKSRCDERAPQPVSSLCLALCIDHPLILLVDRAIADRRR